MAKEIEHLYAELFEAAGVGRRLGESTAQQVGQTQARWQTMWIVGSGALTVPQISRRLGVTRQGVQRVAADIVGEGLAAFHPNPDHKTSPLLELTEQGKDVLERINSTADASHHRILRRFPHADVSALRELLVRFTDAMKAADGS